MKAPEASVPCPDGDADALVLFAATGDLAQKKLHPALFELASRGRLAVPVIGVASADRSMNHIADSLDLDLASLQGDHA